MLSPVRYCPYCAAETDEGGGFSGIADPIETLLRDHEKFSFCLARIENAAEAILAGGFTVDAFSVILDAVQHISQDIDAHHAREEECLMPLLRRHAVGGQLVEIHGAHRDLWTALDRVVQNIKDVEEGRLLGLSVDGLIHSAIFVARALHEHIRMENTDLFPLAKRMLSAEEYEELRRRLAHAVDC